MKIKKRIALLTMTDITNYGSVLQSYASQIVLEKLGYECEIISYKFPNKWHFNNGYPQQKFYRRLLSRTLNLIGYKSPWKRFKATLDIFKNHYLHFTTVRFKSLKDLENFDWYRYHAVISGSDQVWNPKFTRGDKAFLLSFVPDNVLKLSMASSFACNNINDEFYELYKTYLSRLSYISVRDNNGIKIVKSLGIHLQVEVLLDPTLLISASDWVKALNIQEIKKEDYILVYVLNYAFNTDKYIYEVAKEMQRRTGYSIVLIGDIQKEFLKDWKNYEIKKGIPVNEFISLFYNATIVVTSSFHGTAFAINFAKPLISVTPLNGDDRQISLLNNVGAGKNAVNVGTPISNISPYYDKIVVNKNLEYLRTKSINWLRNILYS